ncbi:hypothetical protein AgCh_018424 [Apium graveolens]
MAVSRACSTGFFDVDFVHHITVGILHFIGCCSFINGDLDASILTCLKLKETGRTSNSEDDGKVIQSRDSANSEDVVSARESLFSDGIVINLVR